MVNIILSLLMLTPTSAPRPAEDDALPARIMTITQAIAPHGTLVYEASKRAVFAGVALPDSECAIGSTWTRKAQAWSGITITCP